MKNVNDAKSQQSNEMENLARNNNHSIERKQNNKNSKESNSILSQIDPKQKQSSSSLLSCNKSKNSRLNIALVSDFYYPFVGGVQIHIKQLAIHLNRHQKIGNIIVITHKHDHHNMLTFTGIKNTHGFRVYYLNIHYNKQYMITYPTFIFNFSMAAKILREQNIDIVHCHQSGSTLALEYIFFAKILGIRVILTQHSLYGFRSVTDIHFNRVCQFFMMLCDKIIAVSKTTRNNIILRAKIEEKEKVIVIPNGVSDVSHIKQKRINRLSIQKHIDDYKNGRIVKIISVGRMTYRRGTDLLMEILPELCHKHDNIEILIVGDGVKRKPLEKIIEIHELHKKVKLLGIISDHDKVLEKMSECDIFLNTPLTESFGIALAEAAMLGLCCVSTNVGGVEEAIPSQDLLLTQVQPRSLLNALQIAIRRISKRKKQNNKCQISIQKKQKDKRFEYKWQDVCERTVQLYQSVINKPKISRRQYVKNIIRKGNFFQIFFVLLAVLLGLVHMIPFFN